MGEIDWGELGLILMGGAMLSKSLIFIEVLNKDVLNKSV